MKKSWIIPLNIIIMVAILSFVSFYAQHEGQKDYDAQIDSFRDMTVAMERVTENYLEGEQNLCNA